MYSTSEHSLSLSLLLSCYSIISAHYLLWFDICSQHIIAKTKLQKQLQSYTHFSSDSCTVQYITYLSLMHAKNIFHYSFFNILLVFITWPNKFSHLTQVTVVDTGPKLLLLQILIKSTLVLKSNA